MKTIKYIVLGVLLSSVFASCSLDELMEESLIHATGDDADDPAEPDEEDIVSEKEILFPILATGDDADDPAEPDDED